MALDTASARLHRKVDRIAQLWTLATGGRIPHHVLREGAAASVQIASAAQVPMTEAAKAALLHRQATPSYGWPALDAVDLATLINVADRVWRGR